MAGKEQLFYEPAMKKHMDQFVLKNIINQNIYIPEEIQLYILRNLPGKSLMRFKCINKSLNSMISDPNFINQTPQLILCTYYSIHLLNCQEKATELNLPMKAEKGSIVRVMTSCNGILWMKVNTESLLWNPFTGEHKVMQNGPSHRELHLIFGHGYGFGYDPTKRDYNIICIPFCDTQKKPFIYSVKKGSYESLEEIIPYYSSMFSHIQEGLPMKNGSVLYWPITYCCSQTIDFRDEGNRNSTCVFCHEGSTEWHLFVLEFDLVNRKQVLFPQPFNAYSLDDLNLKTVSKLMDFKGSLCAATGFARNGTINLFLLKEDKCKQNWVKFMSIDVIDPDLWATPMCIKSNEEVVMSHMSFGKIVCYNRNNSPENRFRSMKIHEVGYGYWSEEITYTQSLAPIRS